ncbi:hypothetical protein GCM10010236_25260 [Streptomyces eurythermus]|nr:hypothetical protein GCM10010236_25260 [Streptomyces eurythermus]
MVGVIVRETTQGTRAPARFTARCFIRQRLVYGAEAGMVGVGRRRVSRERPAVDTTVRDVCAVRQRRDA